MRVWYNYTEEREWEIFMILVREYWINKKSMNQINKEYHICVNYWMKKFNIPKRKKSQEPQRQKKDWNDIGIHTKHERMRKLIRKPKKCPICKERKRLALTNLNHEYNNILEEWVWKCYSCHSKYDHKIEIKLIWISEDDKRKYKNRLRQKK